eukprot:2027663-Pleurochrysis_carterae.AAC.4
MEGGYVWPDPMKQEGGPNGLYGRPTTAAVARHLRPAPSRSSPRSSMTAVVSTQISWEDEVGSQLPHVPGRS